jgi:hypothetical protein
LPCWAAESLWLCHSRAPSGELARTPIRIRPLHESSRPASIATREIPPTLLGIGLLLNNAWVLLVLIPVLVTMHYGVIIREEAYLERKFGDEYLRYKANVRRWL